MTKEITTNEQESKPALELTDQLIAACIIEHDVCPLVTPIQIGGKCVNAVIRNRKAVVRDRINAVRFSIDMFDIELSDAVRAYIASQICSFGMLELETESDKEKSKTEQIIVKSAKLAENSMIAIGADDLIDQMGIGDYTNVSYLMGKN
ncbi:hypothetical protein ACNZ70_001903 [Vibrio mimicus]